ncbi:hypothetical protein RB195_023016 [Necator americanus]|uniref:Reverse transcriptase domain-containing protein n=1 Tax=Necator americanus TaxID=51031 RepID=A0ABR1EHF5_NECAM
MPLCLTTIDMKKAFDSVMTKMVTDPLYNQGVATLHTKILRELCNFTTEIPPFYNNVTIDVKVEVRQGDTISPKIFSATLENAMSGLDWDEKKRMLTVGSYIMKHQPRGMNAGQI